MKKVKRWLAAGCLCFLGARGAPAHPTQFTTLQVVIEPDGRFQATLNIDLLSFALGKTSLEASHEDLAAVLAGPRTALGQDLAAAGERFRRELIIHTDVGDAVPGTWHFPGLGEVAATLAKKIQPPTLMPGEITFSGTLPARAHQISVRLPEVLGDTVQVYELPKGRGFDEPVPAGGYCSDIALELAPVQTNTVAVGRPAIWTRDRSVWVFGAIGVALIGALAVLLRKLSRFRSGRQTRRPLAEI